MALYTGNIRDIQAHNSVLESFHGELQSGYRAKLSRVAYSDFEKIPKLCIWGSSATFRAGIVVKTQWHYILDISGISRLIQVYWRPPTVTYISGIGPSCPMQRKGIFKNSRTLSYGILLIMHGRDSFRNMVALYPEDIKAILCSNYSK